MTQPYDERQPRLSPDGKWLAYTSDESGRPELYIQRYPQLDRKIQVSQQGANQPAWSPSGSRLYFRHEGRFLVVDFDPERMVPVSPPRLIADGDYGFEETRTTYGYDVAPDDRLLVTPHQAVFFPRQIEVVFGSARRTDAGAR